jgi:antitoxin PrlF
MPYDSGMAALPRKMKAKVMTTLTVTSKGQVTLRKDILQHLGVHQGDQLEFNMLPGGRLEVRAAARGASIERIFGLLSGKSRKVATIDELSAAAAAGWAGRK